MTLGLFLKVLALVLWLIGAFLNRLVPNNSFNLVAAGLFFWFVGDVVHV